MAPLVPNIISPEFNFVVAVIVGIGFGYALEQAGFSSTRKLVGLFYGYDFTVLKVFFTAGVTAMVGVLFLGHAGLLNLDVIYINPTFIWAAIVGGLIMGAGFIIGGFCPGTSLCAAAVGRIDAIAFIGGSVIGILIFMEAFPWLEPLYMAGNMGDPTIPEWLNIAPETFGIALTIIALVAFWGTSKIEDKVNGTTTVLSQERKWMYRGLSVIPFLLITVIWMTPSKQEYVWNASIARVNSGEVDFATMEIDELAFELVHNAHKYNVIDIRDTASFKKTIPTAVNIYLPEMDEEAYADVFRQPYKRNVIIGDDPGKIKQAAVLATMLGDKDPVILNGSIQEFFNTIYEAIEPPSGASKHENDVYQFRKDARIQLIRIEEQLKLLKKPVKKEITKAQGGCA